MEQRCQHHISPLHDDLLSLIAMLMALVLVIPVAAEVIAGALTGTGGGGSSALTKAGGVSAWKVPLAVLFQQLMMGGLAAWRLRYVGYSWEALGLRLRPLWAQLEAGCRAGVSLLMLNIAGSTVVGAVLASLRGPEQSLRLIYAEQERLVGLLRVEAKNLPVLLVLLLTIVIVAPVAEELFFRGYVYNVLKRITGRWAVVVSSLIFTGIHFYVVQAPVVFILSVVLTYIYESKGSLLVSMSAHGFMNLLVALMAILFGRFT